MLTILDVYKKEVFKDKIVYNFVKRAADLVLALMFIFFLSPILLMLYIVVRLDSKGPAIFKQKRIGKDAKVFDIYKFRTMHVGTPHIPTKDCDPSKYVTKVGKFLRKTSLDELPQIFNVIKGEMSFIGYRPLIVNEPYIHDFRKEYQVYSIKPGITGYAQINGRDLIEPVDKAKYDYFYLVNRSIILDMKILFNTIYKVLKREDIHDGQYILTKEIEYNDETKKVS
ncbi:MAG: lipid carrier--UDP-N-acetylgalactosaminyltransferase [Haloplasmataceae bacterium]|jgi:O-antigen biosynthesis protein WbqP|nr:lipid carrier--UDP-N-acetylgalactosaminyltransferase [Haloplasmataceae bacterium]